MAADWYIEGLWMKNCNCDPGCPCDFNQRPTQGYCEGMVGMHITKGNFEDVDLAGVTFAGVVHWPGAMHEGNGEVQPIIDEKASEEQRNAIFQILSGQHGDTLFEVVAYVCPTVHEPIVAALIFAQKVLPFGNRLTRVFAVAFVAAGIWIASAPGTVPGLIQPNSSAADLARNRMMHMQPGMRQHGTKMQPMRPKKTGPMKPMKP